MARPPEAPPESIVLGQFAGLKNVVTPERLTAAELQRARNVDLDDAGQVRRRRGFTRVAEGSFHSLYTSPAGKVFGVEDGSLCWIKPDYTTVTLGYGGVDPISYHDLDGVTYFTSPDVSGKIAADMTLLPWGQTGGDGTWLSPVVNPTSTLSQIRGKLLGKPPLASYLTYMNGRFYMAADNLIWATELYLYDYVDKTRNFVQFESKITGISNGTDGIYVGTESAVWFLSGPFGQLKRDLVVSSGCIAGSMMGVPADLLGAAGQQAQQHQNATLFMTEQGLIAGFDGGVCVNMTKNDMLFPTAQSVAPMFRKQDGINQYVAVMDSGGSPTVGARIGDYIDAEIRRFAG